MRLPLIPREEKFFDMFVEDASNVLAAARTLESFFATYGDRERIAAQLRDLEHRGDQISHEIGHKLESTFVTPFDRDDMYRLAGALDDICDHVDEAADNLGSWGVERVPEKARLQAEVILEAAKKLDEAVLRLDGFKDSTDQLAALRELEDRGDQLERDAVAELFATTDDAKTIIRWKDIHERLEEAVDALENAADVLEAIVVKNR